MIYIEIIRLRFLVVDDNVHMRRMLRSLLHGFGAREVHEAEDGAAGLDQFNLHSPNIVITDWEMPIFNGLELTQMIRQPGTNADPYVPCMDDARGAREKLDISAKRSGAAMYSAFERSRYGCWP